MSEIKLVSLQNVIINYGDITAVCNASFDIYKDDFVGIVGPNGGGKTSLVKAILGLVEYTGKIEFASGLEKCGAIGYLPQQNKFDMSFPISVREVILSGLQSHNVFVNPSKRQKRLADDLMEMAGITDLAENPIGELSGGQLQRTLLCRALISEPRLLILDEPANFVDNKFERELYELLKKLNQNMAIVMISHDLGTINQYVKNIICVNKQVNKLSDVSDLSNKVFDSNALTNIS